MPVVTGITATPIRLRREVVSTGRWAGAPFTDHVILQIETDDDIVGLGEAPARPTVYGDSAGSLLYAIRDVVGPAVLGLSLTRGDELRRRLRGIPANLVAKGAVENAFFDAVGKSGGFAWVDALGGNVTTPLTPVCLVGVGSPEDAVESIRSARERGGFTAAKLKVGLDWRLEVSVVEAVRDAFGINMRLYADANCAFSPDDALRFAQGTADFGLEFFEDPCFGNAIETQKKIQEYLPVMADERSVTPDAAVATLDSGAANMLNIKPARYGFFGSLWLAHFIEMRELGAIAGSQLETSIGSAVTLTLAACSTTLSRWTVEGGLTGMLEHDVAVTPIRVVNGTISPPSGAGFGVELDRAALAGATPTPDLKPVVLTYA